MIDSEMFGYPSGGGIPQMPVQGSESRTAARNVMFLEDRFERLSLVCMAMWSLIQDQTDLKEEDLLERVHTLDMMDGQADGKATEHVAKCVKCKRTMNRRHLKCLYCGADKAASSAFDRV